MNQQIQLKKNFLQIAWIATRFVVFGIGGFVALWIGSMSLIIAVDPSPAEDMLRPAIALPLALAGGLMMLFGGGVWGRWAYLWVFLSPPAAVFLSLELPERLGAMSFIRGKLDGILVFVAPMIVSYLIVRGHYRRKDAAFAALAHQESAQSEELPHL